MSTQEIRQAELALAEANRAVRIAQLQLARAKSREPEEPPVDTTLQIKVQYREGEKAYTYVAYRTPEGYWLVTGRNYAGKRLGWEDILHLADKNYSGPAHLRVLK
jgi:hypothetical protein